MGVYRFERQIRTLTSEGYQISRDDRQIGRVDLHFASDVVYATLTVEEGLTEDEILELIEKIDEDIVMTADVLRDDFIVTVYQGREVGVYQDDSFAEDEEFEEDEEPFR